MRTRTSWLAGLLVGLALVAPGTAKGQAPNFGPPSVEIPLPLMWGQRDEGPFFAAEAMFMRLNSPLRSQNIAVRGFWDEAGQIDGTTTIGNTQVAVVDHDNAEAFINNFFVQQGRAGAFRGSMDVALTAKDVGAERFEPGVRVTIGYRFENGVAVEAVYHRIAEFKYTAGASVEPPGAVGFGGNGVGQDLASAFVSIPFFNFSPFFAGPFRDIVSNVLLIQNPGTNPIHIYNTGAAANHVFVNAQQLADFRAFGGLPVPAYGVFNGAENVTISFEQELWQFELNARFPVCMSENTRTYSLVGFRYIELQEEFKMLVQDIDVDGFLAADNTATYRNHWGNQFYGVQAGMGNEAYLGNGFALSVEGRVGIFADWQKSEVSLTRGDQADDESVGMRSNKNELGISPLFQVAAYLWWYPVEGVQLRAGYEATGMFGVQRSREPVDFNAGRLDPKYNEMFFRMDGFNLGVAFIF